MITKDELLILIDGLRAVGNDVQQIEVKESVGKLSASIVETLSAFANGSGGLIVLGLSEKEGFKPVKGFDANRIADSLADACSNRMTPPIRPEISIVPFEGALVLVAKINEIMPHDKPCYVTERGTYKGSYIRVADGDRRLSFYEINRLLEEHIQPKHDIEVIPDATVEDLDKVLLTKMLERQRDLHPRIFSKLSDTEALKSLKVLAPDADGDNRPTLAGILAVGVYPQQFFPRLTVTFAAFPGTSKAGEDGVKYLDSQTMAGPIPAILQDTLRAVRRNMRTGGILKDGFRKDVPDYPEDAIREAVCNALMHRDYSPLSRGTQIQVNMYSDRLEVVSPGGLYGTVTVDLLGKSGISSARNQYLSNLLETTPHEDKGFVAENRGTGYQLIEAELTKYGLPPVVAIDRLSFFSLIFRKSEGVSKSNNPRIEKNHPILDYIAEKGEAKAAELKEDLGLSRRTLSYKLGKLVESGDIEPTQPKHNPQQAYRIKKRH